MKEVSQTLVIEEVSNETQELAKHIVLDGLKDIRISRADTIIFFDLPPWITTYRVIRRRIKYHEVRISSFILDHKQREACNDG